MTAVSDFENPLETVKSRPKLVWPFFGAVKGQGTTKRILALEEFLGLTSSACQVVGKALQALLVLVDGEIKISCCELGLSKQHVHCVMSPVREEEHARYLPIPETSKRACPNFLSLRATWLARPLTN